MKGTPVLHVEADCIARAWELPLIRARPVSERAAKQVKIQVKNEVKLFQPES
jgi:hypothetical protein